MNFSAVQLKMCDMSMYIRRPSTLPFPFLAPFRRRQLKHETFQYCLFYRQEIVPSPASVRTRLVFRIRRALNLYFCVYLSRYGRRRDCVRLLIHIDLHITNVSFLFPFPLPPLLLPKINMYLSIFTLVGTYRTYLIVFSSDY